MTDARLPERWILDPAMDRLSDRAWRTWTYLLMYCNAQGTDGLVVRTSFKYLHAEGVAQYVIDELVDANLVTITDEAGLQVLDWVGVGQNPASRVQQARDANRERQQRYRDRKSGRETSDATHHVTRDVAREDQGQERTGQDLEERFARAWEHWPKKKDRKRAYEKFKAAARRRDPGQLEADLIRFGDAYKATTDMQFIPALDGWLSGDRWEDELPTIRGRTTGRPDPDQWMQGSSTPRRSITPEELRANRDNAMRRTFNDQDDD